MNRSRPLVLVGAGGLGREALAALRASSIGLAAQLRGFVDDGADTWGTFVDGVPVLGPISTLIDGSQKGCDAVICTGRPGNTRSRVVLDDLLGRAGVAFSTVLHPTVSLAAGASVGDGCVLLAQVVATAPIHIGRHVVMMPQVVLTHDDIIGDFTTFGAGVRLAGGVVVETGAYVGSGALVREHVTIGAGTLVGMGAVVTHDIPPNEVWVGNPARFVRTLEPAGLTSAADPADASVSPLPTTNGSM